MINRFASVYIIVSMLFSISGVAAPTADEQTYFSLDAEEVDVTPNGILGASTFEKKVGGLVCNKMVGVSPNAIPHFSCRFVGSSRSDREIYEALDVSEENITPARLLGSTTFQKKAGDLICKKTQVVYPGAAANFSCGFLYGNSSQPGQDADAPETSSAI